MTFTRKYTLKELGILLNEFIQKMPISELEAKLNRTEYGIVQKIRKLSIEYPDIWDIDTAKWYVNEYGKMYQKRWYALHSEKIKERVKRYGHSHKDEISEKKKLWYLRNRHKMSQYKGKWYLKNSDRIKERQKQLYNQHKMNEIFQAIGDSGNVGYAFGKIRLYYGLLRIPLSEKNLESKTVTEDFRAAINMALSQLPYIIDINIRYKDGSIILSGDKGGKRNIKRSKEFLEAYKTILERYNTRLTSQSA